MSKVFITNESLKWVEDDVNGVITRKLIPSFNVSPAARYGDLVVLVPANSSLISTVPMVRVMRDVLAKFSDDDFLLPMGDPSTMMVAGAIAAEMNGGRFKILQWDKQQRVYIPIQVDIHGRAL